ncbi:MAG: hypothetical protein M1838_006130 [Thelocarpon superellum]|nr:MAG: hypothetical protein M1838_006130 [Thelocarpon superellum]
MPFLFTLPTTSHLSFPDYLRSDSHPSLPFEATIHRGVLRDTLKRHKRLDRAAQSTHLPHVLAALEGYIPYLCALDQGLSAASVAGEEVDVVLEQEVRVAWRTSLTSTLPGREPARVSLRSVEYEIFFVLSTLAYTHTLMARVHLHALYTPTTPSAAQRRTAITAATRVLLQASSIHAYLLRRGQDATVPPPVLDLSPAVHRALAAMALADATLLAVLQDDPYPVVVSQSRNEHDHEWMIKAPDIPRVRAHLFARLCLAASEHASQAVATLASTSGVDDSLRTYLAGLVKTARGKACRFLALDADLGGKTGEAIGWVRGGAKELGFGGVAATAGEEDGSRRWARWRRAWDEKREDKRVERGGEWGLDGGRLEEGRVLDMLEAKWVKMNDTVNTQTIPPSTTLLARLPSGREIHNVPPYPPPSLDADVLATMRSPLEPRARELYDAEHGDDDDDDEADDRDGAGIPGAFPGASIRSASGTGYY